MLTPGSINEIKRAFSRAGDALVQLQESGKVSRKPGGTGLSLGADVQQQLISRLRHVLPEYQFRAKEGHLQGTRGNALPLFYLDPLDGSSSYVRGHTSFAITGLALDAQARPEYSMVYLPRLRHRIEWTPSLGVRFNGIRIAELSGVDRLSEAYLYVSSDAHRSVGIAGWPGKTRAFGTTAYHLATLLSQPTRRCQDPLAVLLTRYKSWDAMFGLVLAEAAGLDVRSLTDGRPSPVAEILKKSYQDPDYAPPLLVAPKNSAKAILNAINLERPA